MADPVPEIAHVANAGTVPAGAEYESDTSSPETLPVSVPAADTFMAGFTSEAGPETLVPVWVAVHDMRSALPDCGSPTMPDHEPPSVTDEGPRYESVHAAVAIAVSASVAARLILTAQSDSCDRPT
jgi:hypothetical protein